MTYSTPSEQRSDRLESVFLALNLSLFLFVGGSLLLLRHYSDELEPVPLNTTNAIILGCAWLIPALSFLVMLYRAHKAGSLNGLPGILVMVALIELCGFGLWTHSILTFKPEKALPNRLFRLKDAILMTQKSLPTTLAPGLTLVDLFIERGVLTYTYATRKPFAELTDEKITARAIDSTCEALRYLYKKDIVYVTNHTYTFENRMPLVVYVKKSDCIKDNEGPSP